MTLSDLVPLLDRSLFYPEADTDGIFWKDKYISEAVYREDDASPRVSIVHGICLEVSVQIYVSQNTSKHDLLNIESVDWDDVTHNYTQIWDDYYEQINEHTDKCTSGEYDFPLSYNGFFVLKKRNSGVLYFGGILSSFVYDFLYNKNKKTPIVIGWNFQSAKFFKNNINNLKSDFFLDTDSHDEYMDLASLKFNIISNSLDFAAYSKPIIISRTADLPFNCHGLFYKFCDLGSLSWCEKFHNETCFRSDCVVYFPKGRKIRTSGLNREYTHPSTEMSVENIKSILNDLGVIDYTIVGNIVNVNHSVYLSNKGLYGCLPVKFGQINGDFNCSLNELTSLEGAPHTVLGTFDCSWNNLTSLEYSPKKVGRSFFCHNNSLETLKGAPTEVKRTFDCSFNTLKNLSGGPIRVESIFNITSNDIRTFEGFPDFVGYRIYLIGNSFEDGDIPCVLFGHGYSAVKCRNNLPSWVLEILKKFNYDYKLYEKYISY